MPVVRSFLATHPGLAIELKLDDALVDIIAEGVDVAVRIGELAESRLVATKLGETRRLLVASPDYLRYAKPLTTPHDLAAHACILFTGRDARRRWTFDGPGGARAAIDVSGNFGSNSSQAMRAAVLQGLGVGFAPELLIGDDLKRGALVEPLPAWRGLAQPIHALIPPIAGVRRKRARSSSICGPPCVDGRLRFINLKAPSVVCSTFDAAARGRGD
jgi:DNA-binding transcriptional LysR family regulator